MPPFWGPLAGDLCLSKALFFSMAMTAADILGTRGARLCARVWAALGTLLFPHFPGGGPGAPSSHGRESGLRVLRGCAHLPGQAASGEPWIRDPGPQLGWGGWWRGLLSLIRHP